MQDEQVVPSAPHPAWDLGLFVPSVSALSVAETIALAASSGYRCLEWRIQTAEALASSPWGPARNTLVFERLAEDAPQTAAWMRQAGLTTCGVQADVPLEQLDAIPAVLGAARVLGAPLVRVGAPAFEPAAGYLAQRDAFRQRFMAWLAAGAGLRICVENHFDTIAPSATLAADLLQDFDPARAGIIWDPANTVLEGSERPELALDQIKAYLAEVHMKNGLWRLNETKRWTFAWCCLDEGMVDWPQVLGLLAGAGYAGPLVVEDYRPLEPAAKLAHARDYLCSLAACVAA